jgi:hypothetical protein
MLNRRYRTLRMLAPSPPVLDPLQLYNSKIKQARIRIRDRNLTEIHNHILQNINEELKEWYDKASALARNPLDRKMSKLSSARPRRFRSMN